MLTSYPSLDTAIQRVKYGANVMKYGIYDYIQIGSPGRRVEQSAKHIVYHAVEKQMSMLKSRELTQRLKEQILELSVLHELSDTVRHTVDYKTLVELIGDSLAKMVKYDVCILLITGEKAVI